MVSEEGTLINNRYRILTKLGVGGMGTVYCVEDTNHNRRIALKMIREDYQENQKVLKRFEKEGKVGHDFSHENVVKVYDYDFKKDFYITMELLEGGSLEDVIKKINDGQINDFGFILDIIKDIARGLSHLHSKGVVHRDLKPPNFLFNAQKVIKITDFGVALEMSEKDRLTELGEKPGTALYRAPEQSSENIQVDYRADIYALGLIAYELVNGSLPFGNEYNKLYFIETGQKLDFSKLKIHVPLWFRLFIEKCTQIDPDKRYQSMEEVRFALSKGDRGSSAVGDLFLNLRIQWLDRLGAKTKSFALSFFAAMVCFFLVAKVPAFEKSGQLGLKLEPAIMDYWFPIRGVLPEPRSVVIASLDFETRQRYNLQPDDILPRDLLAKALLNVSTFKPKKILVDFLFMSRKEEASDKALADAIDTTKPYLAAVKEYKRETEDGKAVLKSHWLKSNEYFSLKAKDIFFANLNSKKAGVVRSFEFYRDEITAYPPIASALFDDPEKAKLPGRREFINFYGPPGAIARESISRIIEEPEKINPEKFKDRVVLFGDHVFIESDSPSKDTHNIPFGMRMSGVEVHANTISNLLEESWIKRFDIDLESFLLIFLPFTFGYLILTATEKWSFGVYISALTFLFSGSYFLFKKQLYFPVIVIAVTVSLCFIVKLFGVVGQYLKISRRKEILRQ